jgi:hypothetical protein
MKLGLKKSILKKFEPAGLICQIRNLGMRREQTNKKNPMLKEMKLREPLRKKNKKRPDLTWIKIQKPATLITRQIYPYKKQIKTYYKAQFSTDSALNDKIKKNLN